MVPNVDEYWARAARIGARIIIPLADRYYGLRDFTIADPGGFGVRFATTLIAVDDLIFRWHGRLCTTRPHEMEKSGTIPPSWRCEGRKVVDRLPGVGTR
jgi:hypothetical protein